MIGFFLLLVLFSKGNSEYNYVVTFTVENLWNSFCWKNISRIAGAQFATPTNFAWAWECDLLAWEWDLYTCAARVMRELQSYAMETHRLWLPCHLGGFYWTNSALAAGGRQPTCHGCWTEFDCWTRYACHILICTLFLRRNSTLMCEIKW